jgi:hypothetical protein
MKKSMFKIFSLFVFSLGLISCEKEFLKPILTATTGPNIYTADSSLGPNIGMTVDYPIDQSMSLKLNFRKNWMDRNITDSPIISSKSQLNGFIAVTHSFK